ncbi:glycosyltransferase [Agarivorans sp. QJM3NY_33]|uniref:glycosyltransferase n=1 Tax=Agarivorans sp. QJM3NY_33 TaxID=3421432 RepID=UPI003D7EAAA5
MSNIAILMSTYNGQRFLKQQIDSVLAQCDVNVTLFVRDDGSSDNTKVILKSYNNNFENVNVIFGGNVGVARSFIDLTVHVYKNFAPFDYYSFCDQDDFWLPSKLKSVNEIMINAWPCLAVSRFYVSNEKLMVLKKSTLTNKFELGNLIVEGQVPGCAMHFNYSLLEIYVNVVSTPEGKNTYIHDYLLLIIASLKGRVIITDSEEMHYRQHDNNVIGSTYGGVSRMKKYLKYIKGIKYQRTFVDEAKMLVYLLDGANESKELCLAIDAGGNFLERLNCAKSGLLFKRSILSNIVFKILIIVGVYKKYD